MPSPAANPPLTGIRVLDLSRVLAGPVCTQVLADLGADVVKVERPGTGDDTRQWGPPFLPDRADGTRGASAYYLSANRGKRSLAIDLNHPAAREVLADLAGRADILIENFLTHSREKLGLTPDDLRQLNPRLVSVSVSGFGRTGPLADVPGYDLVLQATCGIMSITGEPDGMPMKIGVAITDVVTGLYAAVCALAGLHGRGPSQHGTAFDLALADCTLASLVNVVQGALITGQRPPRFGNAHPHIVPYAAFAAADGHLVLAVGNDRQWQKFCQATGHEDWSADPKFATNPARVKHRDELTTKLQALFAEHDLAYWLELLNRHAIPHAPVVPIDEVLASPQVAARGMVQTVTDAAGQRYKLLASPIHTEGFSLTPAMAPPDLGQHTDEVLRQWLGYDDARLAKLHASGAIA